MQLFDRLLKLLVIAAFVYSLLTEQQYYSDSLRWLLFISSIYFVWRCSQERKIYNLIIFCVLIVLFNPFIEFDFGETIWRIIGLITCIFFGTTLDWKQYTESLSLKENLAFSLIKSISFGFLIIILSIWYVSDKANLNPYYEYLLITESKTADGFILMEDYYTDIVTINDRQSKEVTFYTYDYNFTTSEGELIECKSSDLGHIEDFDGSPLPVKIEYLPGRPEVNRIKNHSSQASTIGDFLWRRLGMSLLLLLMFSSVGILIIRHAIKDYSTGSKKLKTQEIEKEKQKQRIKEIDAFLSDEDLKTMDDLAAETKKEKLKQSIAEDIEFFSKIK